jgi:hypothetical protein
VATVSGKLMEMTVEVDGEAVYSTRHLVPSRPETIAEKVQAAIEAQGDAPEGS